MAADPFRTISMISSNGGGGGPVSSSGRLSSQGSMDSDDNGNYNGNINNDVSCPLAATTMMQDFSCDNKECNNRHPTMKCGRCQSVFYCSPRCQREAYLEHKAYCFDLLERQRDFFRHGAVDGNPYNHKAAVVVAADDDENDSTTATSTTAAASLSDPDEVADHHDDSNDNVKNLQRAKALLDNAKHTSLFLHEKEKLELQAIALLERIPVPNEPLSVAPLLATQNQNNNNIAAVQARIVLSEVYWQWSKNNDNNNTHDSIQLVDQAKRALLKAIRCEVEYRELSSNEIIHKQTRDRARESIQRNSPSWSSSNINGEIIDRESMVLCQELLVSIAAVNITTDFGHYYAKILLLYAQILEAQGDWERALATYDSLTLLYQQMLEEEEMELAQQVATCSTVTASLSNNSSCNNNVKEALAMVLRGTSRCRSKFDDDAIIRSLLPARQALDSYRLTQGGHVYLAKTFEAQSNKEELLEEAYNVVQRGVVYEAPWDEPNQAENMQHVVYFKEEIRQAEIRRLKEQDFMQLWGNVLHASETEAFREARKTWACTRERIDIHGVDSDDEDDDDDEKDAVNLRQETEQRLRAAANSVLASTSATTADAAAAPIVEEQRVIAAAVTTVEQHPAQAAASEERQDTSLRADAQYFVPRADAPSFVPGVGFTATAASATSHAAVNTTSTAAASATSSTQPASATSPAPATTAAVALDATPEAPEPVTTGEIVDGEEFHDTAEGEEDQKPMALDGDEDFVDDSIGYEIFSKIQLTRDVLKWLDNADGRFRQLFVKKLHKLSLGIRSYTMMKQLKGSQSRIYETYLENKSGHRILWQQDDRDHEGLLIWYVVAHKKVSRYMDLIDDASNRSARPMTLASDLPDIARQAAAATGARPENNDTGRILLDPKGDIPLKLYELDFSEIDKLLVRSWRPSLHLTPKEREIVETQGTVCVLGRSGTGKTVVVASRIDYDRNLGGITPNFSQLFVARSQRICNYVKGAVGEDMESSSRLEYMTYNRLLSECEKELDIPTSFKDDKRVDYYRFKGKEDSKDENLFDKDCKLDPLVVWTQIRSFIKSSIEAVNKGQPLTREEYLNLGVKQCRLAPAQRELAYDAFEFYQKTMEQKELWDDTDRVASILRALQKSNETQLKLRRTKLYVDEVQDYTQAEIAMFFMLCSPKGLFLAGDPAQSVEEGVDFRFEDIRVVADSLFKNDRRNIPDKPTLLKVNFRSHAGVLNLAAGILDLLFAAFPGSAKELPKDEGLFLGPRPAVFGGITDDSLKELVNKQQGVKVLTLDDKKCKHFEELLGEDRDVLTIRDSKGLEFDVVLLVDFFKDLSRENHQSWKKLLLEDDKSGIKEASPELEGHLKQMYTAITRCCKRMMFAESGRSVAFDAFIKWAKIRRREDQRLVEEQKVDTVEQIVLTRDEWNKQGVDWAYFAEINHDITKSKRYMEKAVRYFRNGDLEFLEQASTHLSSIEVRIELQELEAGAGLDAVSMDETELSELMLKLIDAGLLVEASNLCRALVRVMDEDHAYSRTNLSQRLLPLLPEIDY